MHGHSSPALITPRTVRNYLSPTPDTWDAVITYTRVTVFFQLALSLRLIIIMKISRSKFICKVLTTTSACHVLTISALFTLKVHYKAIKILAVRWFGTRLLMDFSQRLIDISQRLLQATKAGGSPGNDDEVSTYNLTVFQMFYGWGGLKAYSFEKKSSLGANFEKKLPPRIAALRAAQHGLYTSNLLPTPMCSNIGWHSDT